MPTKLLICDAYEGQAIARLKAELDCTIAKSADLKPSALELGEVEGLLIRSRTKVDRHLLDLAPNLKFVVTATSGFDHIDFKTCIQKGVTVSFTPEANAASAAELTVALMLNLMRRLNEGMRSVSQHKWREDQLRGETLQGKTLGLVGLGRIGQRVARAANALGMKIIAHDPYQNENVFKALGVTRQAFTELLLLSDVVSFHVPMTKETKYMLNHQTFRLINPEAVVINVSRGPVIHESELILALDEGLIRGVALDVYEKEPLPKESRLRGRKNVIMTPHVGAFTTEAIEQASMQAVERTLDFFKTGKSRDSLPIQAGWFEQIVVE
ncbi:MAG: NAD(P)-dependent oxidoreductase [Bdellovibrionales bacterium]